jgi:uncharacterized RDD family membrane protein YckC
MHGPDEFRIETPEQIDLALEPAGLGSRFVALVLDLLLWFAVLVLVSLVVGGLVGLTLPADTALSLLLPLLSALGFLLMVGYNVYFEVRRNGQTPGKWVAGIRVRRDGGGPVDFTASCVRNVLRAADLLPGFYLLGAAVAGLSARRQRIGDLAAGTVVIRERVAEVPEDLARVIEKLASAEVTFTPEQVAACAAADRHVLRSFFRRQRDLDPQARLQLATRLAENFAAKTGYQPPDPLTQGDRPLVFLASLYRDLESWATHGRK